MKWAFTWSEQIRSGLYYELLSKGFFNNKPDDIEPEIGELGFYLDAFRELGTCRPGGLDLQPIPFTAIIEYSKIYELGDAEDFYYIIRKLDNTLLELNAKKEKQAVKSGGTNADKTHKNKR